MNLSASLTVKDLIHALKVWVHDVTEDIEINQSRQELYKKGKSIRLSSKKKEKNYDVSFSRITKGDF